MNEHHSKSILIAGGCGYIGSHVALYLQSKGYFVVLLDLAPPPPALASFPFVQCSISDKRTVSQTIESYQINSLINCAAFIEVRDSIRDPHPFYSNNLSGSALLFKAALDAGVTQIIFSSSCAVYGTPQKNPIDESTPRAPISPYGKTKLACEWLLEDYHAAYNAHFVSFRFFNAAGSAYKLGVGENHEPETHIIPLLIKAALTGKNFTIFGNTHPTEDGTCIRDYLSVRDIAHAHHLALEYLQGKGASCHLNLGSGQETSILQLIETVETITKHQVNYKFGPIRHGDPARLVADITKAREILSWTPHDSLEQIIEQAYLWYELSKNGETYEQDPASQGAT